MGRQTGVAIFLCGLLIHIHVLKTDVERFLFGLLRHILKYFCQINCFVLSVCSNERSVYKLSVYHIYSIQVCRINIK
jgi:hypothetical protein